VNADTIVVGAGLFGQTIASELRRRGQVVRVLDDARPESGSAPSASLMKPSWLNAVSTKDQDISYETLDRLFHVHELRFKVGPVKLDAVRWCNPDKIRTAGPVLRGRVLSVSERRVMAIVDKLHVDISARHVVVAAGSWTHMLVPGCPPVQAKMGAACFWPGASIPVNLISLWAPYRQLVAFNMNGGVWAGDGTAVKPETWNPIREVESVRRCAKATGLEFGSEEDLTVLVGRRPYLDKRHLKGQPCYLAEHEGVWVATGGAKNGTIAAGWVAAQLGERLT